MTALVALAWRFRKPLGYALAVLAVIAMGAAALAWHGHKVKAFGAERYAAGESAERVKWQAERDRERAAREVERRAAERDQAKLAAAQIQLERDMEQTEQERDDALARALATADMSVCRIIPDSILQPFRRSNGSP